MKQEEINIHKELIDRIKKTCAKALLNNTDTPEGIKAFEENLKHICHTAEVIAGQIEER